MIQSTKPPMDLVIPAHNESEGIGVILERIFTLPNALLARFAQIVVVDDQSTDNTYEIASRFPVTIARTSQGKHLSRGKGQALSTGFARCSSQVIVTCDADLENFEPRKLIELADALDDPDLYLIKAGYETGGHTSGNTQRVTSLTARPLLQIFFPELTDLKSPLSGEMAMRREIFKKLLLMTGYCVDIGLLLDVNRLYGRHAIHEIPLGDKVHRHHDLNHLANQATEVSGAILYKAGVLPRDKLAKTLEVSVGEIELELR